MKSLITLLLLSTFALAEEKLERIEIVEYASGKFSEFWEENKFTQIYSGKKNTLTSLDEIPKLQTNNYRQATSQTPGLLISEVPNESLAAITYRGLGDPHESYNILMLQDGIPVAADMYGYPAHYFSPALPMMSKIQFIRGGASLLYGPQPGGALNYYSRALLKNQKSSNTLSLSSGTNNLLTTNNALLGSSDNKSYAIEYHRRQGDGPQSVNSDFYADYIQLRQYFFLDSSIFKVAFNAYNSDHGNPGGFAKKSGPEFNTFGDDQKNPTRKHDRLKVSRAQLSTVVEKKIDSTSQFQLSLWANAYKRYSKSQSQGNDNTFGGFPTGTANNIVTQSYYGYNGDFRYLKNYGEHTFTAGYLNYNLISPYVGETGKLPDSNHGDVTRRLDRTTHVNSFFAENRFALGQLLVTPGIRIENIRQTIDERKNTINNASRNADSTENVPLLGIGISYHTTDYSQLYANVSQSYKPVTYQEAVPLSNNSVSISDDIDPSKILTYELGHRGQTSKINWDISLFYIRYENKFGLIDTTFQNTGAGTNKGIDLSSEIKLSEFYSPLRESGDFNLYGNIELLDARFTKSSPGASVDLKDKTPQYAPKVLSRLGLIYNKEDFLKAALMAVMVGRHFGDDANSEKFEIPPYTVFDLTIDFKVSTNWLISSGINNLLDREYYSRVRSDGINWALGRNFYAGATYQF